MVARAGALAVTVVLCFLLTAAVLRQIGTRRLSALEKEIRERGDWATLEEFLDAVDIDPALQETFWGWSQRARETDFSLLGDDVEGWLTAPPGTPAPAALTECLREHDALMEEGLVLLRRPELVISSDGWAALDLASDATTPDIAQLRTCSLLSLRAFGMWMSFRALMADSADPWLRDFDRLIDAFTPPGSYIEVMILYSLLTIRDEAYLAALARGSLSEGQLERWIAQRAGHRAWMACALRGERLLFWSRSSTSDVGRLIEFCAGNRSRWEVFRDGVLLPWYWSSVSHDITRGARYLYRLERYFHGDRSVPVGELDDAGDEAWTPVGQPGLFIDRDSETTLAYESLHRAFRAAGRALSATSKGSALPVDRAAFVERWPGLLDGNGDGPRLGYRRLAGDRFRIGVDIDAVPTDPIERQAVARFAPLDGTSREFAGLWTYSYAWIEVRIPAWFGEREQGVAPHGTRGRR